MRHFHEKLKEVHNIHLSYTWVQKALQGAGLVARRGKRGKHRRRREPRPLTGMLLHIDGSKHQRFCDERWYDLIVILDDATKEIYYAQLVEEESTRTVMTALRAVIERKALFCALYSDRGSHFFVTVKAGEKVDKHRGKFTVPAKEKGTAFRRASRTDLNWVFTVQTERVVDNDNTVAIGERNWQLEKSRFRHSLAGSTVTIHEHLDASVSIRFGFHRPLGIPPSRDSHFPTATAAKRFVYPKTRKPASASRKGSSGGIY
jgi:hypothetical protein